VLLQDLFGKKAPALESLQLSRDGIDDGRIVASLCMLLTHNRTRVHMRSAALYLLRFDNESFARFVDITQISFLIFQT
jgi:hypothetical protein